MSRRIAYHGASTLVFLMLVVSCSGLLKKKEEDAGADVAAPPVVATADEAGPATPTPEPAAIATNEGDVARFPDETPLANVPAVLQRGYNVREAPPAGTLITTLGKGQAVTQIATRQTYVLIVFEKTPGVKQMGWVHKDAFSAVIVDAGPLVCPTGEVALFADTPFCGKLCSKDSDCPPSSIGPQACKGSGSKLRPDGKPGDSVTVCTVFHPHDAGPPAPPPSTVDAGKPATVDAGPVVVDSGAPKVDAAPPPPPPGPAQDVVAAGANKTCPGNFVFVNKTGKCHRPCPKGPTGGECQNKPFYCITCDNTKKVCGEAQAQCRN